MTFDEPDRARGVVHIRQQEQRCAQGKPLSAGSASRDGTADDEDQRRGRRYENRLREEAWPERFSEGLAEAQRDRACRRSRIACSDEGGPTGRLREKAREVEGERTGRDQAERRDEFGNGKRPGQNRSGGGQGADERVCAGDQGEEACDAEVTSGRHPRVAEGKESPLCEFDRGGQNHEKAVRAHEAFDHVSFGAVEGQNPSRSPQQEGRRSRVIATRRTFSRRCSTPQEGPRHRRREARASLCRSRSEDCRGSTEAQIASHRRSCLPRCRVP